MILGLTGCHELLSMILMIRCRMNPGFRVEGLHYVPHVDDFTLVLSYMHVQAAEASRVLTEPY